MVHTVFSVDGSLYHRWQADLLAYSHQKVHQLGPLTRLRSAHGEPLPFAGQTFQTEPYSPHPITRDDYAAYNKPKALQAWLHEATPTEDIVLLLDPDCVFLAPLTCSVSRGHPIAQTVSYMSPVQNAELVKKHCFKPDLVQSVGIPILIHRDDLKALVQLWLEKTEAIRNDPRSCDLAGWVAEMWGYVFAAAELGLRHTTCELARMQTEHRTDLPIIHYCYSSSDITHRWKWDKRSYKPWERVPKPPSTTPLASVTLISLLNEWAAIQGYRVLSSSEK